MSKIIISREGTTDVCVPSQFLTDYMPKANGEFVKIYLYILLCFQSGAEFSLSELADQLEITEKDITRAIKYWEGNGIFLCEREGESIISIKLLAPWATVSEAANSQPDDGPEAAASRTKETAISNSPLYDGPSPEVYDYTLSPVEIKQAESSKDFGTLCNLVECHFKMKTLNTVDYERLMWIFINMGFESCEILVEHCVAYPSKGRKMRQLELLTTEFLDRGIKNPQTIKRALLHEQHCQLVKESLGVSKKKLANNEQDFVRSWFENLKISEELVIEACKRTVRNTESGRFEYANKILTTWHAKGITTMDAVKKEDEAFKKSHIRAGEKPDKPAVSDKFVNFTQRKMDFDEQEALIFGFQGEDDKPAAGEGTGTVEGDT